MENLVDPRAKHHYKRYGLSFDGIPRAGADLSTFDAEGDMGFNRMGNQSTIWCQRSSLFNRVQMDRQSD